MRSVACARTSYVREQFTRMWTCVQLLGRSTCAKCVQNVCMVALTRVGEIIELAVFGCFLCVNFNFVFSLMLLFVCGRLQRCVGICCECVDDSFGVRMCIICDCVRVDGNLRCVLFAPFTHLRLLVVIYVCVCVLGWCLQLQLTEPFIWLNHTQKPCFFVSGCWVLLWFRELFREIMRWDVYSFMYAFLIDCLMALIRPNQSTFMGYVLKKNPINPNTNHDRLFFCTPYTILMDA